MQKQPRGTQRRGAHPKRTIFLLTFLMLSAGLPASASDNTFIVPQDTLVFQIHDQDLLRNDGSGAEVLHFTQTSRGTLSRTQDGFTYTLEPYENEKFRAAGMDSFRYVFDAQSGASATVFLLADVAKRSLFPNDLQLEFEASSGKINIREGSMTSVNDVNTSLQTEGSDAYLIAQTAVDKEDPGGCECGGCIDPRLLSIPDGEELVLTKISADDGNTLTTEVELLLSYQASIDTYFLRARAMGDDTLSTVAVPLEDGPQDVSMSWWEPTNAQAMDGTVVLEIGNEAVASVSGLDSFLSLNDTSEARLGLVDASSPITGTLAVNEPDLLLAHGGRRLVLTPIFADGFESDGVSEVFAPWSTVVGQPSVTTDAAIHGALGLSLPAETSSAYLVDDSPNGKRRYRARFSLNLSSLEINNGDQITLFEGLTNSGGEPFSIWLQQENFQIELCAQARPPLGPPVPLECYILPAKEESYSVELQWWTARPSAPNGGGLKLWIRDHPAFDTLHIVQSLSLPNGGQVIDKIRLGAIDPQVGTSGSVFFLDDFESWR